MQIEFIEIEIEKKNVHSYLLVAMVVGCTLTPSITKEKRVHYFKCQNNLNFFIKHTHANTYTHISLCLCAFADRVCHVDVIELNVCVMPFSILFMWSTYFYRRNSITKAHAKKEIRPFFCSFQFYSIRPIKNIILNLVCELFQSVKVSTTTTKRE